MVGGKGNDLLLDLVRVDGAPKLLQAQTDLLLVAVRAETP